VHILFHVISEYSKHRNHEYVRHGFACLLNVSGESAECPQAKSAEQMVVLI
jgi:hypothetical protein